MYSLLRPRLDGSRLSRPAVLQVVHRRPDNWETTELDSTTSVASIDSRSLVGDAIYTLYANVSTDFLAVVFFRQLYQQQQQRVPHIQTIVTVSAAVPSDNHARGHPGLQHVHQDPARVSQTSVDGPLSDLTYYWSAGSSDNEYNLTIRLNFCTV